MFDITRIQSIFGGQTQTQISSVGPDTYELQKEKNKSLTNTNVKSTTEVKQTT